MVSSLRLTTSQMFVRTVMPSTDGAGNPMSEYRIVANQDHNGMYYEVQYKKVTDWYFFKTSTWLNIFQDVPLGTPIYFNTQLQAKDGLEVFKSYKGKEPFVIYEERVNDRVSKN